MAVRMMSGIAKASSRGEDRHLDPPILRYLGVTRRSHPILEVSGHLGEVEVHPWPVRGSMLPPVTNAPKSRKTTPVRT